VSLVGLTVLALCLTVLMFRRGIRSPSLAYVAAFFAYFALGPVLAYLLGLPIYMGTVTEYIPRAVTLYVAVLATWLVVDFLMPEKSPAQPGQSAWPDRDYFAMRWLLWLFGAYGLVQAIRHVSTIGQGKLVAIAAAGPLHYRYLLLQLCLSSLFVICLKDRRNKRAMIFNAGSYLLYCLVFSERDFIFMAFALVIHAPILGYARVGRWLPISAAGFAVIGSLLFTLRQSVGFGVGQILNQGSLLFVDTYVQDFVQFRGTGGLHTYSAALGLSDSAINGTLAQWLADNVSGGRSGYGFSLTAEAYLNGGLLAVVLVFAALGIVQRFLVNRVSKGSLAAYFSPLSTTLLLYGFRGELANIVHGLAYGLIVFLVVRGGSIQRRSAGAEHQDGSGLRQRPVDMRDRR
jgi:hypothetical protein